MHDPDPPLEWVYPVENESFKSEIIQEFNLHPTIAQTLIASNYTSLEDINHFLFAKLPSLYSPELMKEMPSAVEYILKAIDCKKQITILGDDDVDGITGTALLVEFLTDIGADVSYVIPSKTWLNSDYKQTVLKPLNEKNTSLVITVDCGITAFEELKELADHNIDVIITDHHIPKNTTPPAVAIINPKSIDNDYPNSDLTGVGVAFKLAHAIINKLVSSGKISSSEVNLKKFLDLVALGTVADMGTLKDENRILVRYGLKQFSTTKRIGLIKLLEKCQVNPLKVSTGDISSKLAPVLNSLGRIDVPEKGVALLLTRDTAYANKLVSKFIATNERRRIMEKEHTKDVQNFLDTHPNVLLHKAIAIASNKWHPGIIPILAAKLSKQFNRPALVIASKNGVGKGSIRSIQKFSVIDTLKKFEHLMLDYGGHDFAAGLLILEENIAMLKKLFIDEVDSFLKLSDIQSKIKLSSVLSFEDISFELIESLEFLKPFGIGNNQPIFYADVELAQPPRIIGKTHLKLVFTQKNITLEGIGFGLGQKKLVLEKKKNRSCRIAFFPQKCTYKNKGNITLIIKDFK